MEGTKRKKAIDQSLLELRKKFGGTDEPEEEVKQEKPEGPFKQSKIIAISMFEEE